MQEVEGFVSFSIPLEVISEACLDASSLIQYSAGKGKIVMEQIERPEQCICTGRCENCPVECEK